MREAPERYFQTALFLIQKKRYVEALKSLDNAAEVAKILLNDPDNKFFQTKLKTNLSNTFTFGNFLYNTGRFPQAQNFYELSVLISQKLLETNAENVVYQSNVAITLNNLGTLLKNMGRLEEAKEKYEKALQMRQKLLETNPKKTEYQSNVAMTLNNLGTLLKNMGRIEEAKKMYEEALEKREKLLKKYQKNLAYQSDVATTLNNLGNLLSDMGRIEEAKQRYEEALEKREKLLNKDPKNLTYQSDVATTLNNLGILLKNMGSIEDAKERYKEALEIREKLLNKDPENVVYQSEVAMTLNNLGTLYSDVENIQEAKEKYEKSLQIRQKLLATDTENVVYQSEVAMTLNNLGVLLKNMENIEEAQQRYENALEIYEKLLKTDPENVAYQAHVGGMLNNIGNLLSDMGSIEEAKQTYEKALEMREKLLKTDPENVTYQSYVGTTFNNLGNLLSDMGSIEEAKQTYEKALEIYTEPMQCMTIGRKSESIIRLIELNSKKATTETNPFNQMRCLKEAFQLCKENREFYLKYELKHERKLVTEAGLSAYIDFLIKNVRLEDNPEKRAKEYEKAIQYVENLGKVEDDETVSKLCSSDACYLRGRKLVNEALASRQPDLELLKQAVEQFQNAKETYEKANVCFCVYIGLLKILEDVNELEEVDVPKLKELVKKVLETLPEDVNPSIRVSFENIPQIFEEKDKLTRKELLKKLDERVSAIEYKALENFFGHIHEKIKDYFEEPFSPNLIYENWKLKVTFDDPEKVKGKLMIKTGNRILFNRALSKEEIEKHLLEIDYLKIGYFPKGEDEIIFTTPGQKKPVLRPIDYFESVGRGNKTRIFQCDCCNGVCVDRDLKLAAVQLKYNAYGENSVVKLTTDDAYRQKVMTILDAVKDEADIVVFPEFSIPFEYLEEIQKFADENEVIVVAGSHYVTEGKLGEYGKIFSREFEEEDLRKNISPVVIPSSKIVHNEKLLGAREEREIYFKEGMKAGKINHIFKLRDDLRVGLMICYEYLNADLRNHLIPACDVIVVPQTNPSPKRFYETAKNDINNPPCSGNRAYIMANGIFTLEKNEETLGGSTGIVSTLDKSTYGQQNEGIIEPVDEVMEQFILLASISKDFNPAKDTQVGQIPIKTKLIHIFEKNEIFSCSEDKGKQFIQLLETIAECKDRNELREIFNSEENKATIKIFSPLMHKHIQNLEELTLDEMKKKCCCILILAE
ncbi:hypothetical protein MSSIH_1222 [Methanosarcina siciliae HI350]|uniref:Uncharacterized protein n=1 Tax=Methanosarcina siciliae HI350 TaxID=1434119 RepID=A0A0E3PC83_9EURY|nr:hypothetical protein MSSIH_1222 [Methanosarcina siciliae HI350]